MTPGDDDGTTLPLPEHATAARHNLATRRQFEAETVARYATIGVLFRNRAGTGFNLRVNDNVAATGRVVAFSRRRRRARHRHPRRVPAPSCGHRNSIPSHSMTTAATRLPNAASHDLRPDPTATLVHLPLDRVHDKRPPDRTTNSNTCSAGCLPIATSPVSTVAVAAEP